MFVYRHFEGNIVMDVSVIIVNYNTRTLICNCLNSIFEYTKDIDYEVIVSDNGSKDGSIEMIKTGFPQVVLIENKANIGFGAANNRGLKIAKGKYILYLNSDTVLLNNAIKIFYDYWEMSSEKDCIGALGGILLDASERVTHSSGTFPNPWKEIQESLRKICVVYIKLILDFLNINYRRKINIQYNEKAGEVDYVTGADLFLKNNELAEFNENYFLYYEETELQWRLMKKGLKRIVIPNTKIIHFCGKSDTKSFDRSVKDYVTFGAIQMDLSRIRFIKNNISVFCAGILKVLQCLFWLTPIFLKKTKNYFIEVWKI